jgi:putative transposase
MKRNRFSAEQIVNKLRQAEALLSQGQTVSQVSKSLGVTEQTYYRWRKEYGGVKTDQARRLKDLERENARLNEVVG